MAFVLIIVLGIFAFFVYSPAHLLAKNIKASDWNSSKEYLTLANKYEFWTQKVIVNNPSCFTAAQVVIAQSFVGSN